jgi:hypothetical protein
MNFLLKAPLIVGGTAVVGITEQTAASGAQKLGNLILDKALKNYTEKANVENLPMGSLVASNASGGLVVGAAAGLLVIAVHGAKNLYKKSTDAIEHRKASSSRAGHQLISDQTDMELEDV